MAGAHLRSNAQMQHYGQPCRWAFLGSPVLDLLHELSSAQLPSDLAQRGSCKQLGKLKPEWRTTCAEFVFLATANQIVAILPFPYTGRQVLTIVFLFCFIYWQILLRSTHQGGKPQRKARENKTHSALPHGNSCDWAHDCPVGLQFLPPLRLSMATCLRSCLWSLSRRDGCFWDWVSDFRGPFLFLPASDAASTTQTVKCPSDRGKQVRFPAWPCTARATPPTGRFTAD